MSNAEFAKILNSIFDDEMLLLIRQFYSLKHEINNISMETVNNNVKSILFTTKNKINDKIICHNTKLLLYNKQNDILNKILNKIENIDNINTLNSSIFLGGAYSIVNIWKNELDETICILKMYILTLKVQQNTIYD